MTLRSVYTLCSAKVLLDFTLFDQHKPLMFFLYFISVNMMRSQHV